MYQLKIYWDKSFTDWRYRLLLHLCFWGLFLFSWLDESMEVRIDMKQHILVTLSGIFFVMYLYYTLVYFIFPLLTRRKWFWSVTALIVFYIIAVIWRSWHIELIVKWHNLHSTGIQGKDFFKNLYERQLHPTALMKTIFSGMTSLITIIYIPLTIKFIRYAYQFSQKQAWMEKENTRLRLETLRTQLNPHFFFNTLNNLQSFIVQNEKAKSVDLLTRLADFMRSSVYDGEQEMISAAKEIQLISNYIAIEKVRFEEHASIYFELQDSDPDFQIPPYTLLTFIENTFKHGGSLPADEVNIHISVINTPKSLLLHTRNNFIEKQSPSAAGGIGLQNVRKRFDYYFKTRYQLDIYTLAGQFNVKLKIDK